MLRRWLIALVAVLALSVNVGCGAPIGGADAAPESVRVYIPFAVFSPSEELYDDTVDAAEAWAVATGRDIRVESGGTPITLEPTVMVHGEPACGAAEQAWITATGKWSHAIRIEIAEQALGQNCQPVPLRIRHEMGHVLSRTTLGDPGHAPRGLMSPWPGAEDLAIDADALAVVCATEPCF